MPADHVRPAGLRRASVILGALLLLACAPEQPERFQVVTGRAGDYGIVEAPIPELTDARRMLGTLGDGRAGGYIDGTFPDLEDLSYEGGGALTVEYHVQDGVGVPLHPDGLELFSYYHTLSTLRTELDGLGVPTDDVFPVPFAYQPSVAGSLLSSNAAYVSGGVHLFVLLPGSFEVPLTANPGVIRHEFGHAIFSSIVVGDVFAPSPQLQIAAVGALNEGFADMLATLSLDEPDYAEISIDLNGARDVRGDHSLASVADPAENPYSRGTVYASFAWDLRERLDDPDVTLRLVLDTLEAWAAGEPWEDGQDGVDRYVTQLADAAIAARPNLRNGICDDYAARFPGIPRPGACP